jgi:hypothetical protein
VAQRERFVDASVAESQKRLEQELRPFWRDYARPVDIFVPAAGVRQVAHQLGTVPDGFLIVRSTGILVAAQIDQWTADLAYVQAVVPTRAVLVFYTLREEPIVV